MGGVKVLDCREGRNDFAPGTMPRARVYDAATGEEIPFAQRVEMQPGYVALDGAKGFRGEAVVTRVLTDAAGKFYPDETGEELAKATERRRVKIVWLD